MKLAIGGDHAGFQYKIRLIDFLKDIGHDLHDFGSHSSASVDYPDHVHPLAQSISKQENEVGILICGSGNGVAIVANKYPDIRAAICWNTELAKLARKHNNANVLCLPARFIAYEYCEEILGVFIEAEFEGGRHQRRINKIIL